MPGCETDGMSDSDYFSVAQLMQQKSSPQLERIYKQVSKAGQKEPEESKPLWKRFFSLVTRWKWIVVIGLGLLAYLAFRFVR